ncbi:hypothetical protein [Nocardia sp. NPDC004860]|uniref:hypothetical protein n=1 Tax=Nocardia sp. NPDC004860 TaxID=3154557 RepID=UPI0033B0B1B9
MTPAAGTQVPADTSSTHAAPLRHMETTSLAKASNHLAGKGSRPAPKPRITLWPVSPPDTEAIQGEGPRGAVDNAYGDPERAARQLGNTKAVAKAHYIDIPETAPDNREVLERWARGERPKT